MMSASAYAKQADYKEAHPEIVVLGTWFQAIDGDG